MADRLKVFIQRETEYKDLPLPDYATCFSSGVDLHAAIRSDITVMPGQWRLVSTGIRLAIPTGYEGQVRPRSGLALKYGVTLLNTPGTIDSDYRGIIGVILINLGEEPFIIHRGDRIAQLVITPIKQCVFEEVVSLRQTQRGSEGFGSTGFEWPAVKEEPTGETTLEYDDDDLSVNDDTIPGGSGA